MASSFNVSSSVLRVFKGWCKSQILLNYTGTPDLLMKQSSELHSTQLRRIGVLEGVFVFITVEYSSKVVSPPHCCFAIML